MQHIPSHLLDPVLVHHLTEVIFQRILSEIRQGLVLGDHINGEVEVHLHTIGVSEFQILHGLVEVPVLLIQSDFGKISLRGISSFFWSSKNATRFRLSSEPPIKLPQYFLIYIFVILLYFMSTSSCTLWFRTWERPCCHQAAAGTVVFPSIRS